MPDQMNTAQNQPVTLPVCADADGVLPSCAPLANPYVPFQQTAPEQYEAACALIRGTLFPGLDLPYRNMVNTQELAQTLMNTLSAAEFAINELGLYLDTHSADTEAVQLYNQYVEQYQMLVQQLQQQGTSLVQMDSAMNGSYTWLSDPWPWDAETEA